MKAHGEVARPRSAREPDAPEDAGFAARRRRAARGPRRDDEIDKPKLLRIATTTMHDRPWSVVAADRE